MCGRKTSIHTLSSNIEQLFAKLTTWVYLHGYLVLFLMLAFTLSLAMQSARLTFDTRDESFFHEDDPTMVAYNEFRDRFGLLSGCAVLFALTADFFLAPALLVLIHKKNTLK